MGEGGDCPQSTKLSGEGRQIVSVQKDFINRSTDMGLIYRKASFNFREGLSILGQDSLTLTKGIAQSIKIGHSKICHLN